MSDLDLVPGSRYVASLLQSEPRQFNLFLATPSENQGVCLESCRENITNFISPPSQQPTQLWYAAALLLAALRIAKIPAEHRRPRPHFGLHLLNLFQSYKIFSDNLGRTRGQGPLSPFSINPSGPFIHTFIHITWYQLNCPKTSKGAPFRGF